MKRVLGFAALLLLVACPYARADEAARREKVRELISVMHVERLMDQTMGMVKAQIQQSAEQVHNENLTPEQRRIVANYQEQSFKVATDAVGWNAIEPDFIDLYAKTFTDEEIDGMVNFYKSPAGLAMITKMPQLATASMTIVQEKMAAVQPKLKQLQDDFLKQMAAATPAPAKQSAPPVKQ